MGILVNLIINVCDNKLKQNFYLVCVDNKIICNYGFIFCLINQLIYFFFDQIIVKCMQGFIFFCGYGNIIKDIMGIIGENIGLMV